MLETSKKIYYISWLETITFLLFFILNNIDMLEFYEVRQLISQMLNMTSGSLSDTFEHKLMLVLILYPLSDKKFDQISKLPKQKKVGALMRHVLGMAKRHNVDISLINLYYTIKDRRADAVKSYEIKINEYQEQKDVGGYDKLSALFKLNGIDGKRDAYKFDMHDTTYTILSILINKREFMFSGSIKYYQERYINKTI